MKNKIMTILKQLDNQSKTVDECLEMIMNEVDKLKCCANCENMETEEDYGETFYICKIKTHLDSYQNQTEIDNYCDNWEQKIF